MKTRTWYIIVTLALPALIVFNAQLFTAAAQGLLTPPGPPGPTMKSLAQVAPRTPISSLPYAITAPGSYYLTTNLTGVSGADGITVASDNVTLDLNGFALMGAPNSLNGVNVETNRIYLNVSVCNGTVTGWGGNGVEVYDGEGEVLERLTVSDTGGYGIDAYGGVVRDCTVDASSTGVGIYGGDCVVEHCTVLNSGGAGIVVAYGSLVRDCTVNSSVNDGIDAYHSEVRDCVAENNGYGIYAAPGTVSGCHVEGNAYSGIYADAPGGCQIVGNTCLGNNYTNSTSDAGIYINSSNNRVEANHVTGSGHAGIQVGSGSDTGNVIIKNTVTGDGSSDFVLPGSQIAGPRITTTGTITNANPWANFAF